MNESKDTRDGGNEVCRMINLTTIIKIRMITVRIKNGKNTILVVKPSSHIDVITFE